MKRKPGDLEQRGGIVLGLGAHRNHHRLVHGLFAHAPNLLVGQPEKRMPPVKDLQQRLRVVRQDIAPFDMRQLVQQHRAPLERGQLFGEWLGNQNDRTP